MSCSCSQRFHNNWLWQTERDVGRHFEMTHDRVGEVLSCVCTVGIGLLRCGDGLGRQKATQRFTGSSAAHLWCLRHFTSNTVSWRSRRYAHQLSADIFKLRMDTCGNWRVLPKNKAMKRGDASKELSPGYNLHPLSFRRQRYVLTALDTCAPWDTSKIRRSGVVNTINLWRARYPPVLPLLQKLGMTHSPGIMMRMIALGCASYLHEFPRMCRMQRGHLRSGRLDGDD